MSIVTTEREQATALLVHREAGSGAAYWGPGDHYTFLVTGDETGGAYFVMEALVPPGGGPPPHIHTGEDETFYVLDGRLEFLLGEKLVTAGRGDFVNVPRGTVHRFRNTGADTARLLLTFAPAGIEHWFEETLDSAPNDVRVEDVPDNHRDVAERYADAAPGYGIVFV